MNPLYRPAACILTPSQTIDGERGGSHLGIQLQWLTMNPKQKRKVGTILVWFFPGNNGWRSRFRDLLLEKGRGRFAGNFCDHDSVPDAASDRRDQLDLAGEEGGGRVPLG